MKRARTLHHTTLATHTHTAAPTDGDIKSREAPRCLPCVNTAHQHTHTHATIAFTHVRAVEVCVCVPRQYPRFRAVSREFTSFPLVWGI